MNIGIIGTGRIATALAQRWLETGHSVLLGSRDAGKAAAVAAELGGAAQGGGYQQAVDFGEVIVLTTPWEATEETLRGLTGLAGKVLLETTNKLRDPRPETSTELIARWVALELLSGWRAKAIKLPEVLRVGIEENFGQWAVCELQLQN